MPGFPLNGLSNSALLLTSVFGRPDGLPHTLAAERHVEPRSLGDRRSR